MRETFSQISVSDWPWSGRIWCCSDASTNRVRTSAVDPLAITRYRAKPRSEPWAKPSAILATIETEARLS